MIKNQFLIPECYINKIPYCDECNIPLVNNRQVQILTNPIRICYCCPQCNREYSFLEEEVSGEWKWRTI